MTERPLYRRTFVRLLGFLRPYTWSLWISVVLALISQAAQFATAFLTGGAVANAVNGSDRRTFHLIVVAVVLVGLVRALAMMGRRLIAGKQALGVELDVRSSLYSHLLRLSFRFYDQHQTGQLMSRATVDLQTVRFFLGYGLVFFFQYVITILGAAVIMFALDWELALVSLWIAPLLIVIAYRYSHVAHPLLRDVQQKMADVATVAEENIVGVHVVKSFAQEEAEQRKFEERSQAVFRQSVAANRQRAIYVPALSFLPLLAQATVLIVGGRMAIRNPDFLGEFVTFNVLVLMLVMPLRSLGMWIGQAQRATASGERIFEIMDEPEEVSDREGAGELPEGPGRVAYRDVKFEYATGRTVLDGIDMEIEAGTTVALIGHTGSGKTTLASLVPRFYDVTGGAVEIDGVDVRDVAVRSLRGEIGLVPQDPFLFSAPVRENIGFGRLDATDEQIEHAARLAQAHEFIAELPDGYDTVIGERGITLSGGQRQRIAIARALVVDPRVLIFDDATASVDATTEAKIKLGLREAMKGRTTIIIAHRLSTISLADEIIVLDGGKIAARGTHEDLLASSAVYREVYDHGLLEREFADRVEATATA